MPNERVNGFDRNAYKPLANAVYGKMLGSPNDSIHDGAKVLVKENEQGQPMEKSKVNLGYIPKKLI